MTYYKQRLDSLVKLREQLAVKPDSTCGHAITLAEELHAEVERLNGLIDAKFKLVASDDLTALRTAADKMKEALESARLGGSFKHPQIGKNIDEALANYEKARGE